MFLFSIELIPFLSLFTFSSILLPLFLSLVRLKDVFEGGELCFHEGVGEGNVLRVQQTPGHALMYLGSLLHEVSFLLLPHGIRLFIYFLIDLLFPFFTDN